ncbi:MAG: ribosomal RNA small subunit methyltransferase A [Pyrinomonadaceae bacterium]|nr:ribosomal RNA small subunit methyltransferase A [Pyrinomonadaceae bacterium]
MSKSQKFKVQSSKFKVQKTHEKLFAKKSLGQNFLVDENVIEEIIAAVDIREGETIIEIGAGNGALTRNLTGKSAQVIAIEYDKDLIPVLKSELGERENFKLIHADALQLDWTQVINDSKPPQNLKSQATGKTKIVANLPYYISTAILQNLITNRRHFSTLVLMLQREVVERITAKPGNSERGFLTVLIEAYCHVEKLFDVPPIAFRPVPKVSSSVIEMSFRETSLITSEDLELLKLDYENGENLFRQIVSCGFAQKRKTIANNLKNSAPKLLENFDSRGGINEVLLKSEIEPNRRAETLTLDEWKKLAFGA